ncbi:hypothetical protein A8C32_00845 [Flavivirga aquatica]|uniref:Methyltransferase FkbM domain-containing protein n=1 Tax=Flavivirga aquatica TaxID=1849968 RepID=A0A1E5TBX2_9FLAO|nr:FkbM family methyltransferase [Flavivirga aquatica]OEK08856.1 hypothetical protein A8C32_00845 [Flavivirga aquatica]
MLEDYFNKIKEDFLEEDTALFRFGSIGDGGYFIKPSTLKKSELLFSGGISSNLEFEYDAFRFNEELKIIMVDPTVSGGKLIFKGLVRLFFKKTDKIRYLFNALMFNYLKRNKRCVHLKKWLRKPECLFEIASNEFQIKNNILIKLDIEGSEYDFLDKISSNLSQISAMVFEFHDLHKNHEKVYQFIKNCTAQFHLVHLSINPSGGFDGKNRPKCIEISLERKD